MACIGRQENRHTNTLKLLHHRDSISNSARFKRWLPTIPVTFAIVRNLATSLSYRHDFAGQI